MSDHLRFNEDDPRLEVRFTDKLPSVCIMCGASATGTASLKVGMPMDGSTKSLLFVQVIALFFGNLFFWWNTAPKSQASKTSGSPDNRWMQVPHCRSHGSLDVIRSAITLTAINQYSLTIQGAPPKFEQELEKLNAPPSPELLAAMDQGPDGGTGKYLNGIEKSEMQMPEDFLKELGDNQ